VTTVWIPDLDEIMILHAAALCGNPAGVRDHGRLEACLGQPAAAFGGVEFYPDAIAKASILAYSISEGQPFHDGNKRTAVVAMEVVLERSGFFLLASNDDLYDITLAMAAEGADFDYYHNPRSRGNRSIHSV